MRTTLLAAVSHDLRTPLAVAQAAVSCLRSGEIQLTADDHDELLATAEESRRHADTGADSRRRPDHGHLAARGTRPAPAHPGEPGRRDREGIGST